MVYIGIDLGTTYSCVSVIEHGKPKAIHHDNGKNIVPSVVAYGAEILIGNDALSSNIDMSNILYDSKRLIGWEFLHNLPNAETRQLWTFKVATKDKCAGYVLNKGTPNERFLKPEEVSAEILKYLKVCAEKYLNQKVTGVVVTVPALFQENQRAATEKAIELAKLELKGLLHEPNAAAIAYNEKTKLGNSKLLVFDFGGGTLDVSILEMVGNNVDVMAVSGDIHLGGQDVDARIMKYALTKFKKSSSYDIYQRPRLIRKLREKCREAKEFLSNNIEETNIFILVGGSTRIPKIRELLAEKFGNYKLKLDLNPDEIVSHGAAIFANAIELADQFNKIRIDRSTGATKQLKMSGQGGNPNNQQNNYENSSDYTNIHGTPPRGVEQVAKDQTQNRTQSLNRDPIPNQTWGPARDPLPHQTRDSTSNPTPNNPHIKPITSEVNNNPYIRDAIAIDIGTSKCKIATCKDKYIQIVKYGNSEHESSRSVPSYVALSEQCEWLVGRMAENYAVCLQNVIYDIRWLLGKTNGEINRVQDKKRYFFKRSGNLPDDSTTTFDMIDQDKQKCVVDAKEIFIKLLEPLFTTVYKNFQRPTTIAITVPIKSTQDYKNSVEDCAKSAMSSLTATQNIKLIDEPIAVAAAYAPRLNLHPKGDVALVFCMGAGYLQVAAYFIQQKAQEEKANYWTEWVITKISAIEPIVGNFAGDEIDRRIFEEMMEKLTDQNGNKEPNLSERAKRRLKIACEKMKCALSFAPHTRIDVDSLYRNDDNEDQDLVKVIQKDEIKGYYNEEVDKIIKQVGEIYKDLKPKFILLAGGSTRLPVITEYLTREFPGSTICNFLDVDEVAATGAAAIVSKTVTMAKKSIDYEEVIEIIKQEKEKEKRRNPFVYL